MQQMNKQKKRILALIIAGAFVLAGPASAEKPSWAGEGNKSGKHEQKEKKQKGKKGDDNGYSRERPDDGERDKGHFRDRHREVIRAYYMEQYRAGECPPGLAKKNNGCMPPGQAKKWRMGQPLSQSIVSYELPAEIIVKLGPPPAGHHFVRVDSDILLLATGTGMVIDALQNLAGK
jgi:Ni/Co efflux regulator RcnB